MSILVFHPSAVNAPERLTPGVVLRAKPLDQHYLRFTHDFPDCVYFVQVTSATAARDCGKPIRMSRLDLDRIRNDPEAAWGRLDLPEVFASVPPPDSIRGKKMEEKWKWIQDLVQDFESERTLRDRFTERLLARAAELNVSWLNVRRAIMSYYYFGQIRQALGGLATGPKPTTAMQKAGLDEPSPNAPDPVLTRKGEKKRRPGNRSNETKETQEHSVTLGPEDVAEMHEVVRRELALPGKKKTYEEMRLTYLRGPFALRYPEAYALHADKGLTDTPVSYKIFYRRAKQLILTAEQEARLYRSPRRADTGHVRAKGPGDVCEVDGTGGRLWLMARGTDGKWVCIGKPNLYIFIDRWSRFVHGVHLSLTGNSSERLSKAFEYAFTSREARFHRMGITVTEKEWPRSWLPTQITTDRGPEFLSKRTVENVVSHLGILHVPLSPYFPDGKPMVERFIKTLKERMSRELKGAFAKAIRDRDSAYEAEQVKEVAIETLEDAYRAIVEIIVEYNHTWHEGLETNGFIKQHGIRATPHDAYVEGYRLIEGLSPPSLSDDEIAKLLLTNATATLKQDVLSFKSYLFVPADALAVEKAREAPEKGRKVKIKVDADGVNVYLVVGSGRLAHFRATVGTLMSLGRMPEEEDQLRRAQGRKNLARHRNERERVHLRKPPTQITSSPRKASRSGKVTDAGTEEMRELRQREQDCLESKLDGRSPAENSRHTAAGRHASEPGGEDSVQLSRRQQRSTKFYQSLQQRDDQEESNDAD